MLYTAIVNVPGYLPQADEMPLFNTPREAWEYLAEDRKYGVECMDLDPDTDETYAEIRRQAEKGSTDYVWGTTPGTDSPHDLGLAYSVIEIIECPECGADLRKQGYPPQHQAEPTGDICSVQLESNT